MRKSPEPIILAVALALLAIVAALLALEFPSVEDITGVSSTTPKNAHRLEPLQKDTLQASLDEWTNPVVWTAPPSGHKLFISPGFLFYASEYPNGKDIVPVDPNARTASGVLISWYKKYGLDFTDPNIDREDPDNDGFSNITEFKNGVASAASADGTKSTNPLDPQSHPTYLSRIRLQKYESRPFHILFRGYEMLDGKYWFQISLTDEPSYNQPRLKETGDPLGFEGYTVGAFHLHIVPKVDPATHITEQDDESTLELDKPDIGFKIVLPFRQTIDSPESTADFVMLMPSEIDKVFKVPRGKMFTPPLMGGATFLVIDANATGAVLRDKNNKDILIPLLEPKEWDEVPLPKH